MKKMTIYSCVLLVLLFFSCKSIQNSTNSIPESKALSSKPIIKKKAAHYWSNSYGEPFKADYYLWTWLSEYDRTGNIIRHEEADKHWSVFKYDKNDSLVYFLKTIQPKRKKTNPEPGVVQPLDSSLVEISRDELGLRKTLKQTKVSYGTGEKQEYIESVKYKHDDLKRKIEVLHTKFDGGEELKTYQYEDQMTITRIRHKRKDKKDLCSSVDTSFFDEKGLPVKIAQASNCNPFKARQFYRCNNCWIYNTYDEDENLYQSVRVSFEGDTISGYYREYDERKELLWSESFDAKGETVRNDFVVEKILNEQGDCTFFKVIENGEVLRAEKFEYEYWPK